MFASVPCAYALWAILGLFGAHRFYVGRPVSGFVWMFTGGLFGIGWVIDFFLLAQFVEENNKRVFHQQMLETGNSLLFDGEYGGAAPAPYYPSVGGGAYGGGASASYGYAAVPRGGGGYEQPSYY